MSAPVFKSFFIAGFECSTHRLRSGKRLDMLAATRHDEYVYQDYRRLKALGIETARDGIRWHLVEPAPGRYDFSSAVPFLHAARKTGMQVIWDLCHFGWPDDLDIFRPEFVRRFARMARQFARVYESETDQPLFVCPVNEISFVSWAGGDVGYLNPFALDRSLELKTQLVRAAIEVIEAVWDVVPGARIVHVEPAIHIVPDMPEHCELVDAYRFAQYQSWDMIAGRIWPQLGGDEKYLDIIGANYYWNNQWIHEQGAIDRYHPQYRPFSDYLRETYERYERPLFISETGIEDDERPDWLRYMMSEVHAALDEGTPVEGLCWYPILSHPGWDNDRHCPNGLWDDIDERGERVIYEPLADELRYQQRMWAERYAPQMASSRR